MKCSSIGTYLRRLFSPFFFLLALALVSPCLCVAQDLSAAAHALGRQIVISVGTEKRVALKVRNLSTLGPARVEQAHAALEEELRSQSVRLTTETEVDSTIRVTLSENLESYLLIAEIERAGSSEVAIVETSRAAAAPASPAASLPLEKTLLFDQAEQILDLAVISGAEAQPSAMLVLEPTRIVLYTQEASRWQLRQSQPVPHDSPWPRDLRGRILVDQTSYRAYLPGMVCSGAIAPGLTVECRSAADAWPVNSGARRLGSAEFSPRRNFFTGRVTDEAGTRLTVPPFFSVAAVEQQGSWLWVMAGLDGRARLQKGSSQLTPLPVLWGSDLAGIRDCGGGPLVLATQATAENGDAAVAAYRYAGGQFVPATRPAVVPGNVTAFWSAANGNSAVFVFRNRETGNYEAYSLAIACGR